MTDSAELFRKLARQRVSKEQTEDNQPQPEETQISTPEVKKRGRPATGKRSDPNWIGRTYYIRKETDLDIEAELLQLKRQGIELDKSELVDALLTGWLKWRQGENIHLYLSEISPI